jgi:imidazoleglycerol-phosphate dehydratase/histidinol-phosphatase
MDESLTRIGLDFSGRPYCVFTGKFLREKVGDMPTEMVKHFFYSLSQSLQATVNIQVQGENEHHMIESCFKGFARTLKMAVERNSRTTQVLPSTKGIL